MTGALQPRRVPGVSGPGCFSVALLLVGCTPDPTPAPAEAAVERPLLEVFPSGQVLQDGSVSIPEGALGQREGGTPFPVDRLEGLAGFSALQTTVIDLGVPLDPATLPAPYSLDGAVQIWDLDADQPVPVLAELDAFPDTDEPPTLLVRPLTPIPVGHEVLVVLDGRVRQADGSPVSVPWFEAALRGAPVQGRAGDETADAAELAELALARVEAPVLAARWPVGDGGAPTRAVTQGVSIPSAFTLGQLEEAVTPGDLGPGIWKLGRGSFTTTGWLGADGQLLQDDAGALTPGAPWEADLFILIPESLRDAAPGSAPVWQFGHGIFSSPYLYLGDPADSSSVIQLANEAGVIVVATSWPGLSTVDVSIPLAVANDFGRLPELTDRLIQAVSNQVALSSLVVEGALLDDPFFADLASPAVRTGGLRWYGISLGGIAGAVTLAHNPWIEHGVLHVGGAGWSTMLERSDTWTLFEDLMADTIPSPGDRQRLIAASQLLWDPVDPASHVDALGGRSLLWQEALGDERVSNLGTEALLRGVGGVAVLEPAVGVPWGIDTSDVPVPPALAILDPELPLPPEENRPPPTTGAHEAPRHWAGTRLQTARFLDAEDPGVVVHYCGASPCSASNPGP